MDNQPMHLQQHTYTLFCSEVEGAVYYSLVLVVMMVIEVVVGLVVMMAEE
jgi:hypothetical protein